MAETTYATFDPDQQWLVSSDIMYIDRLGVHINPLPELPTLQHISPNDGTEWVDGQNGVYAYHHGKAVYGTGKLEAPLLTYEKFQPELEQVAALRTNFDDANEPHLAALAYKLHSNLTDRRLQAVRAEITAADAETRAGTNEYWITYESGATQAVGKILLSRLVGFAATADEVPLATPVVAGRDRRPMLVPDNYFEPWVLRTVKPTSGPSYLDACVEHDGFTTVPVDTGRVRLGRTV